MIILEKTSKAMKASKFMVWFHLSFTMLSLVAIFLMAMEIIVLDWLALWTIVAAIALNSFFAVLWYDDTKETRIQVSEIKTYETRAFPMISFVVSAFNQEAIIPHSIRSLFKCAVDYRGPSEIILVDDGSTDDTYESAWAALGSMRKELPNIRGQAIKHMAHLGKTEAAKTGSNRAMGEYLALVDAATPCDSVSLNSLVDSLSVAKKSMVSYEVTRPPHKGKTEAPRSILLVHADILRRILNKETAENHELNF